MDGYMDMYSIDPSNQNVDQVRVQYIAFQKYVEMKYSCRTYPTNKRHTYKIML
jgi:hypothetical protein